VRRGYIISTSPDRFRQERERKQANEALRSGPCAILHSTLLSCLCIPSGFLALHEQEAQRGLSEEMGEGGWLDEMRGFV
jgi:hypothetical protein